MIQIEKEYVLGSFLTVQRIALWAERLHKDFPKRCVLTENHLAFMGQALQANSVLSLPEAYQNFRYRLVENRAVFKDRTFSVFQQQQQCANFIQMIMHQMLENNFQLLGPPSCKIGLMLLGSSARGDRLPYSDIELALLYEPLDEKQGYETDHYIAGFIALMELQLIHLSESSGDNQGVWLDEGTSFRSHPHLRTCSKSF